MLKLDVGREAAKQRDALADQHWDFRNDQFVDQVLGQKTLHNFAAVYVGRPETSLIQMSKQIGWFQANDRYLVLKSIRRPFERGAQEIDRLVIWPGVEFEDLFKCAAPDDHNI